MPSKRAETLLSLAAVAMCIGCSVPKFDVPYGSNSEQPTVSSIISRVKCELADMVRDPLQLAKTGVRSSPDTWHELFLLNGDYDVVITLSLETNDTGGLAPNITFMEPVTKLISFSFGGSATLSESRDHTFNDNFQISMRQLYAEVQWAQSPSSDLDEKIRAEWAHTCPLQDSNLSKVLGIKDFVAMGSQTERLPSTPVPSNGAATQAFGGSVSFLVTKNISGVGPIWTTTRWKGPGGLLGLSHVNTDKLTVAFAQGPNAGKPLSQFFSPTPPTRIEANGPNVNAYNFLQQQITQSINSQLQSLMNPVP
jgi:hypothetical protein